MQDAGQRRAFFVKFTEGVDDHGGPYRAAFETSLGEESIELLDLFVPCDNAKGNVGENKDHVIMNKEIILGFFLSLFLFCSLSCIFLPCTRFYIQLLLHSNTHLKQMSIKNMHM